MYVTNSSCRNPRIFKFQIKEFPICNFELQFEQHCQEVRQRIYLLAYLFISTFVFFFINIKKIVQVLENPVNTIEFIQLSPGEYFISNIKI
jgi:sec-independent protein translocase protein TatC